VGRTSPVRAVNRHASYREMRPPWDAKIRFGAAAVGIAFRLLPRSWRFRTATAIARSTTPIAMRFLRAVHYSGIVVAPGDAMLRVLARAMMWTRTRFDPTPKLDLPDDLIEVTRRQGAIFASGHFPLNWIITRYLYDQGLWPAIVKVFPHADPYIWGTTVTDDLVLNTPAILVRFRSILREQRPIVLDIDGGGLGETVPVDTVLGRGYVATGIFRFAAKMNVPIYFACARLEASGEPRLFVRRVQSAEEFNEHFRAQADLLAR
jgi:hypothetical protein